MSNPPRKTRRRKGARCPFSPFPRSPREWGAGMDVAAATGFAGLSLAMAVGRFSGDWRAGESQATSPAIAKFTAETDWPAEGSSDRDHAQGGAVRLGRAGRGDPRR